MYSLHVIVDRYIYIQRSRFPSGLAHVLFLCQAAIADKAGLPGGVQSNPVGGPVFSAARDENVSWAC